MDDLLKAEQERVDGGETPRVFYHPEYKANGHVADGMFVAHGLPEGYELDAEGWEAAGGAGAALVRKVSAPAKGESPEERNDPDILPPPGPTPETPPWLLEPDAAAADDEPAAAVSEPSPEAPSEPLAADAKRKKG